MNISVDKAGDLKIGRKKCRLYKKGEVVKVAKKYGINTEKKTVKDLCSAMKLRVKNSNNIPLAKLYPQAVKKMTPSRKAAIGKKIVTSFMKNMVTTNANIKKLRELNEKSPKPKPSKKARPLTKEEAIKRIGALKGLNGSAKGKLINRVKMGTMSPRRVVKVARELSRLNAPGYRVEL